ncbi:uncharacterized protein VTP21DRAFT_10104 [Calcarisporiella thermophila]|uniref:uncharacterized protein n=1 Tax=Calcarisporiella thermophila TaxID=911321 RepID=UPI0037422504
MLRIGLDHFTRCSYSTAPKSIKQTLLEAVAPGKELSNRKRFNLIRPDPSIVREIAEEGHGLDRRHYTDHLKKKRKRGENAEDVHFPSIHFFAGAKLPSSFPPESEPEIGFVGRSNVGKSSLINTLANSTVVRTKDKPGVTQQINFFGANGKFTLVDMPGYGFAFATEEARAQWWELMETFVATRKTLKRIYVLLDARHGFKQADKAFLDVLDSKRVKWEVILTKCDLVLPPDLARRHWLVSQEVSEYRHALKRVMMVSAHTGAGIDKVRKDILHNVGYHLPSALSGSKRNHPPEK